MAKGASQADLEQGIVSSEPAAKRVAELMRLVPLVLVRHDPRIQETYRGWLDLCGVDDLPHRVHLMKALRATWADWSPNPQAVLQDPAVESLRGELQGLHIMTRAVGLGDYRWLPSSLWLRFAAEALGDTVAVLVPDGVPWSTGGKSPKRTPSGAKERPEDARLEDLERNVMWWYRCNVADPRVTSYRLAKETGFTEPNVRQIVKRVTTLLACIDAPLRINIET